MSTHKAAGKTKQHVSPEGKRLGVKVATGQRVSESFVLIRQRGTLIKAGKNVRVGRDHTLYAVKSGIVQFTNRMGRKILSVEA